MRAVRLRPRDSREALARLASNNLPAALISSHILVLHKRIALLHECRYQ